MDVSMETLDGEAEVSDLPLERLEAEICELAGHMWAAECRWLLMVGEFDRRDGWGAWGIRSCAHWLAWRCGIGLGAAREKVRVARLLPGLPLITGAFSRGQLSYAKVRALTRSARPENEAQLLDLARHATTPQLEKIVREYRRARGQEELDETNDRHHRRYLTWRYDEDGSLVLSGRLSPEDGAVLVAALEAARQQPAVPADVSMETDPTAAGNADALAGVAQAALRGALRFRDRGCRFPGCTNRRFVHGHHVRHWAAGGETKRANVITLCSAHHRLVHEGGYQVKTGGPEEFFFNRPDGRSIPAAPIAESPVGPALPAQHSELGLTIDPATCSSLGEGEAYDLGVTVDALVFARR